MHPFGNGWAKRSDGSGNLAKTRLAAKRPIHTMESEIRFLEYRLAVAEEWSDSGRRQAVIQATSLRLITLPCVENN
jgi:hypothetical protein